MFKHVQTVVALCDQVLPLGMHDIHAVIEIFHIELQDVEVEGRCQHATVAAPLVTSTQQEPISQPGLQKVIED